MTAARVVAEPSVDAERVLLLAADSTAALAALLDAAAPDAPFAPEPGSGPRIGIVDPSPQRIALARKIIARGTPWRGRRDIWFNPGHDTALLANGGHIAFVFPGLEAEFAPRVDDVAEWLGMPAPELSDRTVGRHAAAVFAVGELLDAALRRIGVTPDAVAGHSAGEWQAMRAGGIVEPADFDAMIARADLDALVVPGVEFAVLGCGVDRVRPLLAKGHFVDEVPDRLVISHDNAPNQTVVCGPPDDIAALVGALRSDGVICQPLPFRSGFHTPMLRPYLGPFLASGLPSLPMRPARTPVWSATLARPFPGDPAEIRALSVRQLVEPVRFRELVLAMHAAGVRVFVQAGVGQLGSLIEDTLRDTEHLTVAANGPLRGGLAQLRRVAVAVWVEGGRPDFAALDAGPKQTSPAGSPGPSRLRELGSGRPFEAELRALLDDMADAVTAVITAADGVVPAPAVPDTVVLPRAAESVLEVSTAAMPYLRDHCLSVQRDGWPDETDRRPVVPATTMIAHMIDAAVAAAGGTAVVAEVSDVRFLRWLVAAPAQRVPVTVRPLDDRRVAVQLGEFAEATVTLATDYRPAPDPVWQPPPSERKPSLTARQVYDERWMFHGPAFQGIARLDGLGAESISGRLTVTEPPGSLLDNFGQLLGLWMTQRYRDRPIAFPAEIARIEFHAAEPRPGRTVDAALRVRSVADEWVVADGQVSAGGRPLITVTGWQDYRVEGDWTSCTLHRFPGRSTLAARQPGDWWLLRDPWRSLVAREFYLTKYLGAAERADYQRLPPPQRWAWLTGRIAVKDAVRGRLWDRGHGEICPPEVQVWQDPMGAHRVSGMHGLRVPELSVAASRADGLTVAVVRSGGPAAIEVAEVVEASLRVHRDVSRQDERMVDLVREQTGDALPTALARLAVARGVAGTVGAPAEVAGVDGAVLALADGTAVATAVVRGWDTGPPRHHVVAWLC